MLFLNKEELNLIREQPGRGGGTSSRFKSGDIGCGVDVASFLLSTQNMG